MDCLDMVNALMAEMKKGLAQALRDQEDFVYPSDRHYAFGEAETYMSMICYLTDLVEGNA